MKSDVELYASPFRVHSYLQCFLLGHGGLDTCTWH